MFHTESILDVSGGYLISQASEGGLPNEMFSKPLRHPFVVYWSEIYGDFHSWLVSWAQEESQPIGNHQHYRSPCTTTTATNILAGSATNMATATTGSNASCAKFPALLRAAGFGGGSSKKISSAASLTYQASGRFWWVWKTHRGGLVTISLRWTISSGRLLRSSTLGNWTLHSWVSFACARNLIRSLQTRSNARIDSHNCNIEPENSFPVLFRNIHMFSWSSWNTHMIISLKDQQLLFSAPRFSRPKCDWKEWIQVSLYYLHHGRHIHLYCHAHIYTTTAVENIIPMTIPWCAHCLMRISCASHALLQARSKRISGVYSTGSAPSNVNKRRRNTEKDSLLVFLQL